MKAQLKTGWDFCKRLVLHFIHAGGLQHAGTISFFALLSILPFTIITVGIVANLVSISPQTAAEEPTVNHVLDPLQHAIPFLDETLHDLITSLQNTNTSLSIFSMLMLIFAASAVFNAITNGVNAMLATERQPHSLLTKLILAGIVITCAASIFLWQIGMHLIHKWSSLLGLRVPVWVAHIAPIELGVTILILGVGFYLLVKVTATERYPRPHRWIGTGAFVFAFLLVQKGLSFYLEHVVSYERYYGTAGTFFGLSLWLYLESIVFLGACVVIRVVAEMRGFNDGEPQPAG